MIDFYVQRFGIFEMVSVPLSENCSCKWQAVKDAAIQAKLMVSSDTLDEIENTGYFYIFTKMGAPVCVGVWPNVTYDYDAEVIEGVHCREVLNNPHYRMLDPDKSFRSHQIKCLQKGLPWEVYLEKEYDRQIDKLYDFQCAGMEDHLVCTQQKYVDVLTMWMARLKRTLKPVEA